MAVAVLAGTLCAMLVTVIVLIVTGSAISSRQAEQHAADATRIALNSAGIGRLEAVDRRLILENRAAFCKLKLATLLLTQQSLATERSPIGFRRTFREGLDVILSIPSSRICIPRHGPRIAHFGAIEGPSNVEPLSSFLAPSFRAHRRSRPPRLGPRRSPTHQGARPGRSSPAPRDRQDASGQPTPAPMSPASIPQLPSNSSPSAPRPLVELPPVLNPAGHMPPGLQPHVKVDLGEEGEEGKGVRHGE